MKKSNSRKIERELEDFKEKVKEMEKSSKGTCVRGGEKC